MVGMFGQWIPEETYETYPKEKWCDCDYIAAWIEEVGYEPKTSVGNLVKMILIYYDEYLYDSDNKFYTDIDESENGNMISIKDISCFVDEYGGLKEFDYYC